MFGTFFSFLYVLVHLYFLCKQSFNLRPNTNAPLLLQLFRQFLLKSVYIMQLKLKVSLSQSVSQQTWIKDDAYESKKR